MFRIVSLFDVFNLSSSFRIEKSAVVRCALSCSRFNVITSLRWVEQRPSERVIDQRACKAHARPIDYHGNFFQHFFLTFWHWNRHYVAQIIIVRLGCDLTLVCALHTSNTWIESVLTWSKPYFIHATIKWKSSFFWLDYAAHHWSFNESLCW